MSVCPAVSPPSLRDWLPEDHFGPFRQAHQDALAGLSGQVLAPCAKPGMVSVRTVAVDGTRVAANASRDATVDYEQFARTILEEAGWARRSNIR